jgi:transposase
VLLHAQVAPLSAGGEGWARSAAILFSITGSCRLHKFDQHAYLVDVLGRINEYPVNRIHALTPANLARG